MMFAPAPLFSVSPRVVEEVRHQSCAPPWVNLHPTKNAAKAMGIRYERRVLNWLNKEGFLCGQWFSYCEGDSEGDSPPRFCQVDAYHVANKKLRIVEVKIRWCSEALVQLLGLYAPLLKWYYNSPSEPSCYVICKSFDPAIPGSSLTKRVKSLDEDPGPGKVGVLIWQ
jgi:hypothetical protein